MNLSFFTDNKSGSGKIRGEQIANYLGVKLNPTEGYENDICIYVKSQPPENFSNVYLDIVDGKERIGWIKRHPEVGIISISKLSQEYLADILNRKDIYLIPQHHCNFERKQRKPREVRVVGYIGGKRQLNYDY